MPEVTVPPDLPSCCASRRWGAAVSERGPYPDVEALVRTSDAVFAELDWPDLEEAMAAHPRIGERAGGQSEEAAWSRQEQSAAATEDAAAKAALAEGNAEYERRFGHVFLICATGLSTADVLAALRARLDADPAAERGTVRDELRKIAALRLVKALTASLSTHVLDTASGRPAAGVPVRHERLADGEWTTVAEGRTDADGRIAGWQAVAGQHRLVFDTGAHLGPDAFYPEAAVAFRVSDRRHHHVPLLVSPFGYTTYRGS